MCGAGRDESRRRSQVADPHKAGEWSELDAILAVVIGGTLLTGGRFNLITSALGALIIQSLVTGLYVSKLHPTANLVVKALVVLAVLLLQSAEFRGFIMRPLRKEIMMKSRFFPLLMTFVVFALLYAYCYSRFSSFGSMRVVCNLLRDNAYLGIPAIGMTFVIISGGIDLSVGSVIGFTGVFCALMISARVIIPWSSLR